MQDNKHKLLLILPAVVLLAFVLVIMLTHQGADEQPVVFSNTNILPSTPVTKYNAFKGEGEAYNSRPLGERQGWQDSSNIKHGGYMPRIDSTQVATTPAYDEVVESKTKEPYNYTSANETMSELWSWIPTTNPNPTPKPVAKETVQELAMREYGNAIGERIKLFATKAGDQPQAMRNFMQDRSSQTNIKALQKLGNQYITLSTDLLAIPTPDELSSVSAGLIDSYKLVGEATKDIALSTDDEDALSRIYSYNTVVENFARSFIRLSNVFGTFNIKFRPGEGGDILMPPM